jgi:ligand-binding sensor domain-containing protein
VRKIILLFLLLNLYAFAGAQEKERFFSHYNSTNGLTANNVQCIAQDPTGYIWLATTEGLVKYDGYHFRVFRYNANDSTSLSCNNISYVLPIDDKQLLVGTYDCGINIFDTKTARATRIHNDTNALGKTGDNRVLSLFKDKQNRIWVGLNDGSLNQFDSKTNKIVPILPKAQNGSGSFGFCHGFSEHYSDTNLMWIGTLSGLVLMDKNTHAYNLHRYADNNPKANWVFNRCRYPVQTDENNVWMASWGGGVMHYNTATHQWENFLLNTQPPLNGGKNVVLGITPKSPNELWVATNDSGLAIFNTHTKTLNYVGGESNGNKTQRKTNAQYVFKDKDNNLWTGYEAGLSFNNSKIAFEKHNIPAPTKTTIKNLHFPFYFLEDEIRNGLWLSAHQGDGLCFYSYTTKQWTTYAPNQKVLLPRGMLWGNDGNILLLTATEFWHFNVTTHQYSKVNTPDTIRIDKYGGYSLLRAKNQKLYIGTTGYGVFEWDEATNAVRHFYHNQSNTKGLPENGPIYDLHEDIKGNIWVGTETAASVLEVNTGNFTHFSHTQGNATRAFKGIYSFASAIDGIVWMSTISSGLLAIDPQKGYTIAQGFDVGNGLLSNTLLGIESSADSLLLIYTPAGLQFLNPVTRKSNFFSTDVDWPFKPSDWATLTRVNNTVYVGCQNGFYKLNTAQFQFPQAPKPPTISRIMVFEKEYPSSAYTQQNIGFNYHQNFIRIYFTNFEYTNTKKLRLNYIVKGLSEDTFYTEKGINDITLIGLAAGDYDLVTWMSYPESGIASPVAVWAITISPPWWQTQWFIALVVVVFLLLTYLLYRYRLSQAREKSNLKRQLAEMENTALRAQMNPHFLFNSLNSVNYYIQNNEPAKASQYLKKFSKLVRIVLNNSRKDTVTLEDELEALKLYLEFEELRFNKHFSYQINIGSGIELADIIIPPLLLQPYVENAIWHGVMQNEKGGQVSINIMGNADSVTFVVEDNGIGRKKAEELKSKSALKQKSHGLDITQERIRLFNATQTQNLQVQITDVYDAQQNPAGTKVTITYKQQNT